MLEIIANMSVMELVGSISTILFALSVVVQVTPIKINPWSWVASKIGKAINKDVIEKVGNLEKEISEMKETQKEMKAIQDERDAIDARSQILRFGDEILHDVKHSQEHFNELLRKITEYNKYCDSHPEFKNQMTESTTKHILETYERCMREHDFL